MKALEWFQARALARMERRAIRREGWEKWLLYRSRCWLIYEVVLGIELLRVVRTTDFTDLEFLAKDWTDELWEGGTRPPCTNASESTGIPGNDSGGAGTWTETAFCGGAGEGGTPRPTVISPELLTLEAQIFPLTGAEAPLVPDGGGGTCWVGAVPAEFVAVMVRLGPGIPESERGGAYQFYLSETGAALNAVIGWGDPIPGITRHLFAPNSGYGPGTIMDDFFDATWDGAMWPNYNAPSSNLDPISIAAGATLTARVDYLSPSGKVYTAFTSLAIAPAC